MGKRLLHGTLVYGATNFGLKGLDFGLVVLYTRFLAPAFRNSSAGGGDRSDRSRNFQHGAYSRDAASLF